MGVSNALKPRLKRTIERRAKPRVAKIKVLQICQPCQAPWKWARQGHIIVKKQTRKVGQVAQFGRNQTTQRIALKPQVPREVGQIAQFGRNRPTQRIVAEPQGLELEKIA